MRLVPLQLFVTVAFTSGQPTPPPDPAAIIQLAATGRCDQALSRFHQLKVVGLDKPLRRDLNLARVRCAISLNLPDEATSALSELRREFPSDSAVLFLAVHTFSDLSMRASQELLARAPESAEVHQLNAEALEIQGKWNEARDEYRIVLEKNPTAPGVHYRIGRLLLSQPKGPTTMDEARREF